jgi:cytosine deaminase
MGSKEVKRNMLTETPFVTELRLRIASLGGAFNAHLHLDRSGTFHDTLELLEAADNAVSETSHLSLSAKHAIIPLVHESHCYDGEELAERVSGYLDMIIAAGATRADTLVDVTLDRVGKTAFEQFLALKRSFQNSLDLRVGAYSPLGFTDSEPERWELLEDATQRADFIGGLPERDDKIEYPDHVGFDEFCRRILLLSMKTNKPLHIHADQKNFPLEDGSERILRAMKDVGMNSSSGQDEPLVWLVHVISPSTYPEYRFQKLLESLVECNAGVICCPSAAISMRQIRDTMSPTFNSIARVLDMLAAGIQVRIGSDNICDITSPAGTPDLMDEIFVLCNAVRFYDLDILAKLGAGKSLSAEETSRIREHLQRDQVEARRTIDRYDNLAGNGT